MGFLPPYPLPSNLRALLPSTCKYNTRPLRHMINRMVQNWELNLQILDLREQQIEGPSWIYWFWHDIPKLSTGYYWACRISYNIIKFNIFKPCLYLFMLNQDWTMQMANTMVQLAKVGIPVSPQNWPTWAFKRFILFVQESTSTLFSPCLSCASVSFLKATSNRRS